MQSLIPWSFMWLMWSISILVLLLSYHDWSNCQSTSGYKPIGRLEVGKVRILLGIIFDIKVWIRELEGDIIHFISIRSYVEKWEKWEKEEEKKGRVCLFTLHRVLLGHINLWSLLCFPFHDNHKWQGGVVCSHPVWLDHPLIHYPLLAVRWSGMIPLVKYSNVRYTMLTLADNFIRVES